MELFITSTFAYSGSVGGHCATYEEIGRVWRSEDDVGSHASDESLHSFGRKLLDTNNPFSFRLQTKYAE